MGALESDDEFVLCSCRETGPFLVMDPGWSRSWKCPKCGRVWGAEPVDIGDSLYPQGGIEPPDTPTVSA